MEQESQKRKLDETNHESQNTTILCANNCGFFGSANTYNLCSKCYKDYLLKQSKNPDPRCSNPIEEEKDKNKTNIEQIEANPVEVAVHNRDPATQVAVVADEGASSGDPQKRPTNRCSFCSKRIGLTGFKCRCGLTFCSLHRYSDKHNCVFDYKSAGQDAIAKANPVVKADKIEKI